MDALFDNVMPFPVQGKSNEWYTPAKYIEAACKVMGGIDLDPASCALANQTVKAAQYYTKEDDGLICSWHGSIWLNPPYGIDNAKQGKMSEWIDKAIHEYLSENAKEIVILVNALPDRVWFQPLWNYPICFARKRICFFNEALQSSGPQYGNVFAYLGPHEQKFIEHFSQFGTIAKRVSAPRERLAPVRTLWDTMEEL